MPRERCLASLLAKITRLRHDAELAMRREFPVGARVAYRHGDHIRRGRVIDHGFGLRVCIASDRGARIWLDVYRLANSAHR